LASLQAGIPVSVILNNLSEEVSREEILKGYPSLSSRRY